MADKRTIVSGGTGFVGRFIVEALIGAGHEVTVAGRRKPEPGFFSTPVRFRFFDLNEDDVEAGLFDEADHFVHAAFDHLPGKYRGGEGSDPEGFRRRNLDLTARLFEAAKAAGAGRAVFVSSRAVYGTRAPGERLREEMEARPAWTASRLGWSRAERSAGSRFLAPPRLRRVCCYPDAMRWRRAAR